MKPFILISLLFLTLTTQSQSTQKQTKQDLASLDYILRKVVLNNRPTDNTETILLFPLSLATIKKLEDPLNHKFQYWSILQQYFPGQSIDSLEQMITRAPWIPQDWQPYKLRLIFPVYPEEKTANYNYIYELRRKYENSSVCWITNPVYSPDGKTCIVHLHPYQNGFFTAVLHKNAAGLWEVMRSLPICWNKLRFIKLNTSNSPISPSHRYRLCRPLFDTSIWPAHNLPPCPVRFHT